MKHINHAITHATVEGLEQDGPREIVLRYVDRIVIPYSYADRLPDGVSPLVPLDDTGCGLAEVSVARVKHFHTWDEAESVALCMDADARLLSYAY